MALGVLAAGITISNGGCTNEPSTPPSQLTCVTYHAGKLTTYRPDNGHMVSAGTYEVKSGKECGWSPPYAGLANPPAMFTLANGKSLVVNAAYEVYFVPTAGSHEVNP